MSRELLEKLYLFRFEWGRPVVISPHSGGIGRQDESQSQHNALAWGEVRAVDVFPVVGSGYIRSPVDRYRAYDLARRAGFTGIGLYTDTKPGNMVHLDVREDRPPGSPALWSRVQREYLPIGEVF